jgi:hypothetical protein
MGSLSSYVDSSLRWRIAQIENIREGADASSHEFGRKKRKDLMIERWRREVESGKLLCLPSLTAVGKGLEFIREALEKCEAGVSATKLVVEF